MAGIRNIAILAASLLPVAAAPNQIQSLLPRNARVIETAAIDGSGERARMLVLWMLQPKKVVRQVFEGCSDHVYGDHWNGPTRLTLIDAARNALINTVEVRAEHDDLPIPFFVSKYFYHVPKPNGKGEGTPKILNLKDLTGEGVAGQFVLFDYSACGIAMTSVLGYSPHSDTATQYRVEFFQAGENRKIFSWIAHTFGEPPARPGYWKFTWEPGHGADAWLHEEVTFDPARQVFVDRMTVEPYPDLPAPIDRRPKQRKR